MALPFDHSDDQFDEKKTRSTKIQQTPVVLDVIVEKVRADDVVRTEGEPDQCRLQNVKRLTQTILNRGEHSTGQERFEMTVNRYSGMARRKKKKLMFLFISAFRSPSSACVGSSRFDKC